MSARSRSDLGIITSSTARSGCCSAPGASASSPSCGLEHRVAERSSRKTTSWRMSSSSSAARTTGWLSLAPSRHVGLLFVAAPVGCDGRGSEGQVDEERRSNTFFALDGDRSPPWASSDRTSRSTGRGPCPGRTTRSPSTVRKKRSKSRSSSSRRDADAGVASPRVGRAIPRCATATVTRPACRRELDGVRDQIVEQLREAGRGRPRARRTPARHRGDELDALLARDRGRPTRPPPRQVRLEVDPVAAGRATAVRRRPGRRTGCRRPAS